MHPLFIYSAEQHSGSGLANLLQRRKFTTILFYDIESLLEKIRFDATGIIILDVPSLSNMNLVIQEIENIFHIPEDIPIILLTPYSHNEKEVEEFVAKGYCILEKPVSIETLILKVQEVKEKMH